MEEYQSANELFVDESYEEALELYNRAVAATEEEPRAEFFLRRSACHAKLNNSMSE